MGVGLVRSLQPPDIQETALVITNCGKLLKRLEHHSESITRQVDKKSGSPKRRGGSGILKEEERTNVFFPLHSLVT